MASPDDILQRYRQRTENALARYLPPVTTTPLARLHDAMRYATLSGGKRVRACLVYATGEALGAGLGALDAPACAIELIHTYSLVHDDLPCMDDDDLRRGHPTCHRAYDEATALLAGDALQTLAFELLSAAQPGLEVRQLHMVRTLAIASGAAGMAGGQAVDLAAVGRDVDLAALEDMHRRKTGALIEAAVRLGVQAAVRVEPEIEHDLERYAAALGLVFQIVDDILDVEGDTATLGKTSGADQARDKPTYPSVMGLESAKARAAELHRAALASVHRLGDNGRVLAHLADYILRRTH